MPTPVRIKCTLSALANVWLGHTQWFDALRDRNIILAGSSGDIRAAIAMLGTNRYLATLDAATT
ncbi:hypothetical protein [Amycolatopsis sp. H20-H5]|uniref:hypothetical protein n=1 Tax=Amycolatopsis sp. H20-H5 TaxID=3046309 RepID=UPI002DB8FDFB|nr:hypothetical protein [Amycolatopsis sp. H20-H5]MEC3975830.1 hypothetical protein [Amycolatopsis sp. H20-H5]